MDILVTGANGFIGSKVSCFLEEEGHRVFRIVKSGGDESKGIFEVDLTESDNVLAFCADFYVKNSIDVVIHLASWMAGSSHSKKEQLEGLSSNIEIAKNIVYIVEKLKPRKIVNFSSMAVYPNINGVFKEDSQIWMADNSDCMYGLSKFCSENIFEFMLSDGNTIVTSLRVAQVFGEGMREDRIIPVMTAELKEKNKITVLGRGERVSSFIHVDKLISVLNHFIIYDIAGVFNIGDESLSYLDLANKIIDKYGDKTSEIIIKEEGSRARFILDISKMKKVINDTLKLV